MKEALEGLTALFRVPTPWPAALGMAVAVLCFGAIVYRVGFGLLSRFAKRTGTKLDDVLVRRMRVPAFLLVATLALHTYLAMRDVPAPMVRKLVAIVEVLLTAYLVIEAAETVVLFYWLGERKKIQVPAVVRHLILVVMYTVAVLSVLGSVAGINVLPVLATSTVVTVVLGLALQDTLGNLIAGLVLHAEKPFELGDWIMLDGVEGQVVYIGWRSTRLRTFSADMVALPNAIIARARVQNFYRPDKICARLVEQLVTLSASPEAVESAIGRALARVETVRTDPSPRIRLIQVTPLFQRYAIRFWIDDFQQHDDIESDFMKAMWHECRTEGIALAGYTPTAAAMDPRDGAIPPMAVS